MYTPSPCCDWLGGLCLSCQPQQGCSGSACFSSATAGLSLFSIPTGLIALPLLVFAYLSPLYCFQQWKGFLIQQIIFLNPTDGTAKVNIPVWGIALAQEPQLSHIRASYHADLVFGSRPHVSCMWDVGSVWTALGHPPCVFECSWKADSLTRSCSYCSSHLVAGLKSHRAAFMAAAEFQGKTEPASADVIRHLCLNSWSVCFSPVGERITSTGLCAAWLIESDEHLPERFNFAVYS